MADFKGERLMTRGIQHEIDLSIQLILWKLIDENISKGQEMDYLQVFRLNTVKVCGVPYQEIIHSQEVPPHERKITIKIDNPISTKIYVIDDEEYATMLFPHER